MNWSACIIILEVKLRLNFFIFLALLIALQLQDVNKFSSSAGMSLRSYIANYWPGMHTTALSVVHVNADFLLIRKGQTFPLLVGLLLSKRGLSINDRGPRTKLLKDVSKHSRFQIET